MMASMAGQKVMMGMLGGQGGKQMPIMMVHPAPSTLNPQPSTLNPQPCTLNPQP